jgi:hypothetical protein
MGDWERVPVKPSSDSVVGRLDVMDDGVNVV